jgi:arylsulfatase
MPDRPNMLWICTDQQRYDTIHSLGNPHIRTPNLDRLASEGVAFTNAYSQSPVCTPSRACFLTGRYPRTTRCRQNGQKIPDEEVLVTRMLADEGWDCGLAGKLHLEPCEPRVCTYEERIDDGYRVFWWSHHPNPDWPQTDYIDWLTEKGANWHDYYKPIRNGYQTYPGMPAELHQTTWCAEKTIDFMREKRDGPWLMSVNPFDPHHPFDPPLEYMERYDPDAVPAPALRPGELDSKPSFQRVDHGGAYGGHGSTPANLTERQQREVVAAYYAMVELIDDQVGRILGALEETGQRENTIVLLHSDHGEMLCDHGILLKGPYFYDCAVRVPLIVSWPGHFEQGLRSDALVELTDLAPTLMEACGYEAPKRMQGCSLLPILTGEAGPSHHRDSVYCEYYNAMAGHGPGAQATMYFDGRHKLCVYHATDEGELYDLRNDPQEFENLWDSPAYRELKVELIRRCFDRSVLTMDPEPQRTGGW